MNKFIKVTGVKDNRGMMLVSDRIILCERVEGGTRVVYSMQGFITEGRDSRMVYVKQTVDEIYSLIYDKL